MEIFRMAVLFCVASLMTFVDPAEGDAENGHEVDDSSKRGALRLLNGDPECSLLSQRDPRYCPSGFDGRTRGEIYLILVAFSSMDKNDDNAIDYEEFNEFVAKLSHHDDQLQRKEFHEEFKLFSSDGDDKITGVEFLREMMSSNENEIKKRIARKGAEELYTLYDLSGEGSVDRSETGSALDRNTWDFCSGANCTHPVFYCYRDAHCRDGYYCKMDDKCCGFWCDKK